jgi:energy-coupling factor transport system ATP-binding protein
MTVIFVSHNMEEVAYLADRIYVVAGGKNVVQGTPQEIFGNREILSKYKIGTPETVEILYRLQEMGYPVDVKTFEVESAAAEIVSILQPVRR